MKVAIIESNHWHVPLYLNALEAAGVDVVGVSDSTGATDAGLAARFHCRRFASHKELLAREKIDFAFVFGRHIDMPMLARSLIARAVPFMIEKPCGVASADVRRLAAAAKEKELFVSVPFIFRLSDLGNALLAASRSELKGVEHASFRFIAGPPERYRRAGTPWMLDAKLSGGGPLINVGVHLIDLFLLLARNDVVSVSADATSAINNLSIEDFISVRMRTSRGQVGTLECGYTYLSDPVRQRELTVSVRTGDSILQSERDGLIVRSMSNGVINERFEPLRLETDLYYADVVQQSLVGVREGRPPFADLNAAARALAVVEAAYASARCEGAPVDIKAHQQ